MSSIRHCTWITPTLAAVLLLFTLLLSSMSAREKSPLQCSGSVKIGRLREMVPGFPESQLCGTNPWIVTGVVVNESEEVIDISYHVCVSAKPGPDQGKLEERSFSFVQLEVQPGERRPFLSSFGPLKNFDSLQAMTEAGGVSQLILTAERSLRTNKSREENALYGVDCPNRGDVSTFWGGESLRAGSDFAYVRRAELSVGTSESIECIFPSSSLSGGVYVIGWVSFEGEENDDLRFTPGLEMRALVQFGRSEIADRTNLRSVWTPYYLPYEASTNFPVLFYLGRRVSADQDAPVPLEAGSLMLQVLPSAVAPRSSGECSRPVAADLLGSVAH